MKKVSRQHLVIKRNTLKTLTELPNTAYQRVVGGCDKSGGGGCVTTEQNHGAPPPLRGHAF
jgi:hypothetical protein